MKQDSGDADGLRGASALSCACVRDDIGMRQEAESTQPIGVLLR